MKKAINILSLLVVLGVTSAATGQSFHFTVTVDPRDYHEAFGDTLNAINTLVGGPGAFHVSPGDIDHEVWENRAQIDTHFGASALWYPGVGNHEAESPRDMEWMRDEYNNGNGIRTPLKNFTNQDGPASSKETTYSWDYGNAHFIQLNEYWDGVSDTGTNGYVLPPLYDWMAADLAANTRPNIFVFGHEPAFAHHRRLGDCLNAEAPHRDAFWQLMEDHDVKAYFCGHSHNYDKRLGNRDGEGSVWQIDAGSAGNPYESPGLTFVDVTVTDTEVTYDVYDNYGATGTWAKREGWSQPIVDPTPPPPHPNPLIARCYFEDAPEGVRDWTPGPGDEDLGFSTTIIGTSPDHLGTYDSSTSP